MRVPPRAHLLDGLGPDIEIQKAGMNLVRVLLGCLPSIPAHGHGLCPEDAPDGLARVSDRIVGAPFIDPYIYSPKAEIESRTVSIPCSLQTLRIASTGLTT